MNVRRTYSGVSTLLDKCYWHRRRHNKYSCCTLDHVSDLAQWPSMNMLGKKERKKKERQKEQRCSVGLLSEAEQSRSSCERSEDVTSPTAGQGSAPRFKVVSQQNQLLDPVQQRVPVREGNSSGRLSL